MITYFAISLFISAMCATALFFLAGAPARVRFYVCILLLSSWLFPWQYLQFEIEQTSFTLPVNLVSEFALFNLNSSEQQQVAIESEGRQALTLPTLPNYWFWVVGLLIGAALFVKDAVSYRKQHARWIQNSTNDNAVWNIVGIEKRCCDIRRIKGQVPGMVTGFLKPIIWIGDHQRCEDKIRTIVLHELIHIRQRDTYWLWGINFIQCLFWWNPIVRYTANYGRNHIELSCDEQCKAYLPKGSYKQHLMELTLEANKRQDAQSKSTALAISGTKAFNLQRIHKLNEEHKMKKRYVIVVATLVSLTGWVGYSNATAKVQSTAEQSNINIGINKIFEAWHSKDFSEVEKLLSEAEKDIERYSAVDQAMIWRTHGMYLMHNDRKSADALPFLDKAIGLTDHIDKNDALYNLRMAVSFSAHLGEWRKQQDYSEKWFALADDGTDKAFILYLTAISHFKLEDYSKAINSLNELIASHETKGTQPEKSNFDLLFASYMRQKNYQEAVRVQKQINRLYPSEEGETLLNHVSALI
ncbi:tetratricopeptide repeat protein [Alteromonas sp. 5E99-2]|uniref:M56 family metallopeptidase n=1 Tax=Alteromonas sp. 5E99-2 TaxID=2817683 RepID=UPI001A99AACE|nr:M56 family metallopeptidase [Alteromonas sp. 5E99-2]MBO1255883.1 tetratricopeptide repeat protein [Alteromonas sp. 5E99-2]